MISIQLYRCNNVSVSVNRSLYSWISGDERAREMRQNRTRECETFSRVFVSVLSSSRPSHRARGRSPVTGSGASVAIFRPPRRALTHRFCRWRAPLRHTGNTGTRDARAAALIRYTEHRRSSSSAAEGLLLSLSKRRISLCGD